jgi:hypothetical protein
MSCVSIPTNFINVQESKDATYGYSIENPISIGFYSTMKKNGDAMYYFLSKLQKDGYPLKLTLLASVEKPGKLMKYEKFPIMVGNQLMYNGLLDLMVLEIKGKEDTASIELYFNLTGQNNVKVPVGLTFSGSQNNNIFNDN